MARTDATNFAPPLQFPYATAATDLFKKEDVQVLAQAVDQHDHTAGKGLALPAGSISGGMIADGSITSVKIADGTIATGDLADGAVTSAKVLDGTLVATDLAAGSISKTDFGTLAATTTTSTTYITLAGGATIDLAPTGGDILVVLFGSTRYNAGAGRAQFGIQMDSGTIQDCARNDAPSSALYQVSGGVARFNGVSSGPHSIFPKLRSTDGVSVSVDNGWMLVIGLRR
jgi:hypothetical protein